MVTFGPELDGDTFFFSLKFEPYGLYALSVNKMNNICTLSEEW